MGTGSIPGVKRPGRGADHPLLSKCRGHERVELYLYSPSGPQWPVIGRTLPLHNKGKMKELQKVREDEEKDVNSYWMTLREREDTGI